MLQSLGSQRVGHDWVTEQQYIHTHACVRMYMCIHVSTHMYKVRMYMPTCMCARTYMYHTCMYIHDSVHVYMQAYACVYTKT